MHAALYNFFSHKKGKKKNVNILKIKYKLQLECGPMPNVMVALPNIGGALCSTPPSLAHAHY